jgi:actin-related protein 8
LRIGRASEAFPKTVPHVIARKVKTNAKSKGDSPQVIPMDLDLSLDIMDNDAEMNDDADDDDDLPVHKSNTSRLTPLQIAALEAIEGTLKYRMKQAKRRSVPNANAQVISYNSQEVQETIPDHNDPYKVEWTDPNMDGERPEHFVGEKVDTYVLRKVIFIMCTLLNNILHRLSTYQ